MTRLTMRRLRAMEGALSAMLAGEGVGQGDWPSEVTYEDMEAAYEWVADEMSRRDLTKRLPR